MKQILKKGSTSKRMAIFIADSSSTTGAGLAGLAYNTSGLMWYYWREDSGNNGGTQVTPATATRGAWTSGGFKEIDATNLPGWYEIGLPDALLAAGSYWAVMMLKGAANMAPLPVEIQLVTYDPTDGNLGLTGLSGLTAPAAGVLPTVGTGTNQITLVNGLVQSDLRKLLGTTVTESSAGQLAASCSHFFDVASPTGTVNSLPSAAADSLGGLIVIGTGTRQLNPNAGGVSIAFNGRQQIWEFLTADISASGSIGKLLVDTLDVAISTRLAAADFVAYTPADIDTALSVVHGAGNWESPDVSSLALEASVQDVKSRTDLIPDEPAAVGSVMSLPADGITSATIANGALTDTKFALPAATSGPAGGVLGRLDQVWRYFFSKATLSGGELKVYAEDGTSVLTTQQVEDDGTSQTRGAAA